MIKRISGISIGNTRAITLLEMLVVVFLITVIIGAGIAPYITQQELLRRQFARSQLQDNLSLVMAYISKDVFRAQAVDRSAPSELTVTIPTDPSDSTVTETIIYSLTAAAADGIERNGTPIVIDNDTRSPAAYTLDFAGSDNNYVEVTITGTKNGQTIVQSTAMALRATAVR